MGRSVIAIENSLAYLLEYAKLDSYTIGLILGQSAGSRDYVIHLARTPPLAVKPVQEEGSPDNSDAEDETACVFRTVLDVNDMWVADHAKHVTRMLPGGVWVLGIFVVGPEDVFTEPATMARLKGILNRLSKTLAQNQLLHGNGPAPDKLVLYLNSKTNKYTCKSVEVGKAGGAVSAVDWKFQAQPTSWHQLDCQFDVDQLFPVVSDSISKPLKAHLQELLGGMSRRVSSAVCMVEGELRDPAELLSSVTKRKKGKQQPTKEKQEAKTLTVNLYVLPCEAGPMDNELQVSECSAELNFSGVLASRVFVHQKATVQEAIQALKQDIERSLAARLEMHWDSIIEEENGSPEERLTVHEPPRRVLVSLPHCRVTLSDYLFPGEGPQEALISLQELLDLHVQEADVQKDIETQADAPDLYNPEIENAVDSDSSEALLPAPATPYVTLWACLAFCIFILVASIAVQYIRDA